MSTIITLNTSDSGATAKTSLNANFTNLNADLVAEIAAGALKAPIASPTFTGTVTFPATSPVVGGQWNFGAHTAYFTETDNGNSSTADTIDWRLSNKQKSTLTGNCTFTFTAPAGPCSLILKLIQDSTGSRTVTWPATVHWSGGTTPTLTTTVNKVDIITFYYDGTTYFGSSILNFTA